MTESVLFCDNYYISVYEYIMNNIGYVAYSCSKISSKTSANPSFQRS